MDVCPGCQGQLSPSALVCPSCRRLVHSARLDELAKQADLFSQRGEKADERRSWEQCLELLPSWTVQHRTISERIAQLEVPVRSEEGPAATQWNGLWRKGAWGLGPIVLFLLTKGKVLVLGLTNLGTLVSMAAALGVYWSMYGWAFALGLVISIYIHEMGHVVELRRYGVPASAPMFIPGFGAFVRMKAIQIDPVVDARIGLAGPIYGLGAAVASLAMFYATGKPIWAAIAHLGAVINLFNLIPVWQLDGSRGLRAFTREQRGLLLAVAVVGWLFAGVPMFFLVALGAGYRMFTKDWAKKPDWEGFARFIWLMVAFAVIAGLSDGVATSPATASARLLASIRAQ